MSKESYIMGDLSKINNPCLSTFIIVVHGSKNLQYYQQFNCLIEDINKELESRQIKTMTTFTYLELGEKPLHKIIIDFAKKSYVMGYKTVKIFPLFLVSGTHVLNDIPEEIKIASQFSPLKLELMSHLGKTAKLITFLRHQYQQYPGSLKILFAHGSNVSGGNQELKKIAENLDVFLAYWVNSPSLNTLLYSFKESNFKAVTILPYFLFNGKIIDLVTQNLLDLEKEINIKIQMLPSLAMGGKLTPIIVDLMLN